MNITVVKVVLLQLPDKVKPVSSLYTSQYKTVLTQYESKHLLCNKGLCWAVKIFVNHLLPKSDTFDMLWDEQNNFNQREQGAPPTP